MEINEAVDLIRDGVEKKEGIWADLGAGTGLFTQALQVILEVGKIYAVDKSPHALWRLAPHDQIPIEIVDADFSKPLDLPPLDGIIMANALHYIEDPIPVLTHLLPLLKPEGAFILLEYETHQANPPWIPYPIPFQRFRQIAKQAGLSSPQEIGKITSRYGHNHIYAASTFRLP